MSQKDRGELPSAMELFERPERFPGLQPLHPRDRSFRLWRCPSFSSSTSWTVYRAGDRYLVRRVIPAPRRYGDGPAPWGADGVVPSDLAAELQATLQALVLPPFVADRAVGCDGTTFGVEAGDSWCSTRLEWWEVPPPGWEPLQAWYERAVKVLEAHLPEHRRDP